MAISGLEDLVKKKNHWSLLFEISQVYNLKNEGEMALYYSYKALLSRDPDKMKIKVIHFAAEELYRMKEMKLASMHYQYYKKVREVFNNGKVKEGEKVTFVIEDSFDFSKNKETKEAKYVEVVQN